MNRRRLVNLQIVLVLLVVLENEVHRVIVIRHVGEHLEDLLQRRLRGRILRDREFLLLVLEQSEEEADGFVVAEHSELERAVMVIKDLDSAKLDGQLLRDLKRVLDNVQPLNQVNYPNVPLSIALGFTE